MDCGIIDECRCYKYKGAKNQFCGARRGPTISPCPSACCAGGCSGQPFRILKRPKRKPKMILDSLLVITCLVSL